MNENAESIHQKTERVLLGVVGLLVLVGAGFLFAYGAVTHTQLAATAASTSSAPNMAPPPVSRQEATDCPKGAACLQSKPKEIKALGDCQNPPKEKIEACNKQKAIAEKQISRCTQGTKKGDVCEPYEMVKVVYTSAGCFYKAGEKILGKCNPNPTKECPTVSSTIGALCTWDSKDPNCECGKTSDEKTGEQKQGGGNKGVSPDDIADADQPQKNVQQKNNSATQGADAAFGDGQGSGSGGGGGAPSGGGGGGSDSDSPPLPSENSKRTPLPESAREARAEYSKQLGEQIAEKEQQYQDAVERGAPPIQTDRIEQDIEELKARRAVVAPYEREELAQQKAALDSQVGNTNDWAAQRSALDGQISELDKLMSDYGAQGAGQTASQSAPTDYDARIRELLGLPQQLGGPYANPNLANNTMFYDEPKPDTRTPTLYGNDGSAMGGGEYSSFTGPDGTRNLNGHTLEDYLACTSNGGGGCYVATAGPLSCGGCIRTTLDDFHFKGSDGTWKTLPAGSTLVQYDSGALGTGLDMIPYQGAVDSRLGGTYGTGTLSSGGPSVRGGTLRTQIVGIYTPTQQQALRRLYQLASR